MKPLQFYAWEVIGSIMFLCMPFYSRVPFIIIISQCLQNDIIIDALTGSYLLARWLWKLNSPSSLGFEFHKGRRMIRSLLDFDFIIYFFF